MQGNSTQWTIPLVTCVPPSNSSSSTSAALGTVQALKISGTCTSALECLSGTCGSNGQCDNSIKSETGPPFTAAFTSPSPLGTKYPPDLTLVNQALPFAQFGNKFEEYPNEVEYYWPIMVIGALVLCLLVVAAFHQQLPAVVRRTLGLVKDGGIELKPVSGNMVSDVGDDRVVSLEEGGEGGGERLLRYCAPEAEEGRGQHPSVVRT